MPRFEDQLYLEADMDEDGFDLDLDFGSDRMFDVDIDMSTGSVDVEAGSREFGFDVRADMDDGDVQEQLHFPDESALSDLEDDVDDEGVDSHAALYEFVDPDPNSDFADVGDMSDFDFRAAPHDAIDFITELESRITDIESEFSIEADEEDAGFFTRVLRGIGRTVSGWIDWPEFG